MSRTALFIIDVQNFLAHDPQTRVPHTNEIVAAITSILSTARNINKRHRENKQPAPFLLVFVQHSQPASEGSLVLGSEPWELVFKPHQGDEDEILVPKIHGDAFQSNSDLADKLRGLSVTEIITLGIQSECCVEQTSNGAIDAGFPVTLLSDGAHATYDDEDEGKTAKQIAAEVDERLKGRGAKVRKWAGERERWEREM